MLPCLNDTIGFDSRRIALHLVRAARDDVGHVVTNVLTFPGELVDRLTDTSAGLLILFGDPLPKTPRRIGHSLAKVRGRPWGEPHRQARADERARHESDHEAVLSMLLRVCVHVLVLLCQYLTRATDENDVHNGTRLQRLFLHAA
jgi:hypothetical protein